MYLVSGCKQFVWMGNVSKITSKWFLMEKYILKFDENFIKSCNEDANIKYILEADVVYPKRFCNLNNDIQFLP